MGERMSRLTTLGAVCVLAGVLAGCQHFPGSDGSVVRNMEQQGDATNQNEATAAQADADDAVDAPSVAPAPAPVLSRVDEVRQHIQNRTVRELRTTYNGIYGASLLFHPDDLVYYAVLFENRNAWRVVKTDDATKAEKAYRDYAAESAKLAKAELERIQLEARYNKAERELLNKADELTSLQRDIELRERQESVIKSQQAQLRSYVEQLSQQQKDAEEQLKILQRQIETLEQRARQ